MILDELKSTSNRTTTENGALTYLSSGKYNLDLFATIGALRGSENSKILKVFTRAFAEDQTLALRILFFARDIREGLGERETFRTIIFWLGNHYPEVICRYFDAIVEFGRYDDLFALFYTAAEKRMLQYVAETFRRDIEALERGENVSLLGKWLPSDNASNRQTVTFAVRLASYMGLSCRQYRKKVVALRRKISIIEDKLRRRDYTFDYEKVPSQAMFKYRYAFTRNDSERYFQYLDKVAEGKAKMNTSTLTPYQLVRSLLEENENGRYDLRPLSDIERASILETWRNLIDYTDAGDTLMVIDTSGSMYYECDARPAMVALSLALYFAERNKGPFGNYFVEFSENARLIELKGADMVQRLEYLLTFNEIANTNVQAVFDLILEAAIRSGAKQSDLPARMLLVSDMEFDDCVDDCVDDEVAINFELAKAKFAEHGYTLPEVVFWNVCSRNTQQPVTYDEKGVKLVSGLTPTLFKLVAKDATDPMSFMLEVANSPRYSFIDVTDLFDRT